MNHGNGHNDDGTRGGVRKGVLLLNYGGPRNEAEVFPFLQEIFGDPALFRYPAWIRKRLARHLAARRTPVTVSIYGEMGRYSPIWEETGNQARALQSALGDGYRVFTGMRYFPDDMRNAARNILDSGIGELLLLPLFPQESETTTGSAIQAARASLKEAGFNGSILESRHFFREPGFLQAVCSLLGEKLSEAEEKPRVIFCAHGLPLKLALRDNYQDQVRETAKLVSNKLSIILSLTSPSVNGWQEAILAFHGKVGPMRWLKPSVEETIEEWSKSDCRSVLLVPISFVSEHSETLYEMDILYRELAESSGIKFSRVQTVRCHPLFIDALAEICRRKLDG